MRFFGVSRRRTNDEPERTRLGRGVRIALAAFGGLVVLFATGVAIAARDLGDPWMKHRVQALIRNVAGVDVDYRSLKLRWLSGASIEDLVVK